MVTVGLELTRALLSHDGPGRFTLFASRERPPGLPNGTRCVLSPYRHELLNKLRWLPAVEAEAGLDAMLYPYWPSPPRRRPRAPAAAVYVHDLAFRIRAGEVPWQQRLYLGTLLPRAVSRAAAVLTPSRATRADLLEHFPQPGLDQRTHVVPEGSGLESVAPGSLPRGLEPGFILAVGTVEPRKNYARLLVGYRQLRAAGAPPLVVAGRVPSWAPRGLAAQLRSEPGVRLLGHVDDSTLLTLYRSAAVLAFPSLYEGYGLPLVEAMREGLPAVVSVAGALPEVAAGAALVVDPLDPEAISAGLGRALGDQALRTELAARGRRRAGELTWEAASKKVLAVLDSLA